MEVANNTPKCAIKTLGNVPFNSSNTSRIDDKIEHARFVKELSEEKKKTEKKYFSLLADVKKFTNESEKMVVQQNYHRIKADAREEDEIEELKNELCVLKHFFR
jgi:uncharacterized protein YlxW (UPF0749 family)